MEENDAYKKAKKKVTDLKGFYSHLAAYIIINVLLALVNLITSPQSLWFYWVTFFWGIGLLMHAWNVFGHSKVMGDDWEEKKIQEYMDKEKKN